MEHRAEQWAPLRSSMKEGRSILPGHVLTALYMHIPDGWAHYMYDWRAARSEDGTLSLLDAETWSGHDAIDTALLERARATREWFADPLSHLMGVDVELLMTTHRDTPIEMVRRDGRLTSEIAAIEPGDTLIPFAHTLAPYGDCLASLTRDVDKAEELHDKLLSEAGPA